MKLNIWIEVSSYNIGNDGKLRQDSLPAISTTPFVYPMNHLQRFKVEVEIPYKIMEVNATLIETADIVKEESK